VAAEKKSKNTRFPKTDDKRSRVSLSAAQMAAPYLQAAARLRQNGRITESLAPLQQAVRVDPGNAAAQHDLGLTYLNCDRAEEATACFRRAVALKGDFAHAHYRLGIALELRGCDNEAIQSYQQAVAQRRKLADANTRLGNLLLKHGRRKESIDAFRAAAADAPNSTEGRLNLVKALLIEEKDAEAEVAVRRVLARDEDKNSSPAHWMLGTILAESGRFNEAVAAFERSIALGSQQGIGYYDLARVRSFTDADRPLIKRMLAVAQTLRNADQRVLLQLALGKAYDDLKDYGAAMRHFVEANNIKKALTPFDQAAFLRRINAIISRFTAELIAAHRGNGSESSRPIFIVGMPRSGTTLVEQVVSSHKDIAGAGELRFWTQRGAAFERLAETTAILRMQRQVADDYLSLLHRIAPEAARVTDKMPFNFIWAGLIHLAFPHATIIHCRRNPIDTCLSVFSTYFAPRADFSTDRDDLVFYYQQYLRLMAHWRAILPADRFIEVDYELLVGDPEPVSRRLIAACGLDWDPACLAPERNDRLVKTASKWQARQPIYSSAVERWRHYEPWIGSFRNLLLESGSSD
jgi:tetratricopeptide (TPR) repeat protein